MHAAAAVDRAAIDRAVAVLMRGGLVAFPTETVYGLGADAQDAHAVAAIFRAKGRPQDHPLIVHIATVAAAGAWAREIPPAAAQLMEHFWPGPLTVILPRSARASDAVTGGQDSVGLRCPADPWAQALLRAFCAARGDPAAGLAAPSANRYGRISPTQAQHVRADLGEKPAGRVDCILEGGHTALGIESTIVDFPAGAPRILRPGSIDRTQMRVVLGRDVALAAEDADAPRASGRMVAHYAPAKPLEIVAPERLARHLAEGSGRAWGVFAPAELIDAAPPARIAARFVAPADPGAYAHVLYDALRALDASAAQRLLVSAPPAGEAWRAVHDRLQRAAAGSAGG